MSAVDLLLQAERRLDERADATPSLKVEMLAIIGESLFGQQEIQQSARVLEKALRIHESMPPTIFASAFIPLGGSCAAMSSPPGRPDG